MTVKVRGRVPRWANTPEAETAAQHIQERLHAVEVALAGGAPQFVSPSVPTFGSGPIVAGGGGGGGGGGGTTTTGVTDHGMLTGLTDDDHPQYVEQGDAVKPHGHGPYDVSGLETRFVNRFERNMSPHTHGPQDILGYDQRQRVQTQPHVHILADIADVKVDAEMVLMSRIFGG